MSRFAGRRIPLVVAALVLMVAALAVWAPEPPTAAAQTVATPIANADGSYNVAADWELVPEGLPVGSKFRILVVTTDTRNAEATGIAAYNTFVQNAVADDGVAALKPYSAGFRVVGSAGTTGARWNTGMWRNSAWADAGSNIPIYWLDGKRLATGYQRFFNNEWTNRASASFESGAQVGASHTVFTGTAVPGRPATGRSLGTTSGGSDFLVVQGTPRGAGITPIANGSPQPKATQASFYAMSPVFVVVAPPATPVPSDWVLKPSGLNPGDKFRLLFVTSNDRDATSSDINVYNKFVQDAAAAGHADLRAYSAGFRALASTSNTDSARLNARLWDAAAGEWRDTGDSIPTYWVNGRILATSYSDLCDNTWTWTRQRRTEAGTERATWGSGTAEHAVWTGTSGTCTTDYALGGAGNPLNNNRITAGKAEPGNNRHIDIIELDGMTDLPLYGISEVFEVAHTIVPSDWELIPPGLSLGDNFRLIFVSSTTQNANASDIATYNTLVQNAVTNNGHRALKPYSSGFRVVGSTSAVDARVNTSMYVGSAWADGSTSTPKDSDIPIYWVSGGRVAVSYQDFYDNSWTSHNAPTNEAGEARGSWDNNNNSVRTGSTGNGVADGANVLGRAGGGQVNVAFGRLTATANNPLYHSRYWKSQPYPFYGLSQVFTVGAQTDEAVEVNLSVSADTATEGGTGPQLTVTLASRNDSGSTVNIPIRVRASDTTAQNSDYTALPSHLGVDAGHSSAALTFTVTDDNIDEPRETVVIELGDLPSGYTAGDAGSVTITIIDDEETVVSLTGTGAELRKGGGAGGTATFTLSLTRPLVTAANGNAEDFSANLVIGGPAVRGTDYTMSCSSATGVTCNNLNDSTMDPRVRFEGTTATPSATSVDVMVTTAADVNDGDIVTIALTSPGSLANYDGGIDFSRTDNEVVYTLRDPTDVPRPTADLIVPNDWSLIPDGLESGDRFRLLFVTSAGKGRNCSASGIEDFNGHIQGLARAGHVDIRGYGDSFTVVGSTSTVDARVNTGMYDADASAWSDASQDVPVYWLGGKRVATSYATFYSGTWTNTAQTSATESDVKDENGAARTWGNANDRLIRTGTDNGGTANADHPLASGAGAVFGQLALAGEALHRSDTNIAHCGLAYPFYGISAEFEVGAEQTVVPSDWSLKPSGLNPGDQFRLMFVTKTERNAQSTDIADYNKFVQDAAASGHADIQRYSRLFRVLGSTATVHARENLRMHDGTAWTDGSTPATKETAGVPIYWLNSTKVADSYADLFDGAPWDDVTVARVSDESGGPKGDYDGSNRRVWTGTGQLGEQHPSGPLGAGRVNETVVGPTFGSLQPPRGPLVAFWLENDETLPFYGVSPLFEVAQEGTIVPADWELRPSGLETGDGFRFVFVSSTETAVNDGMVSTYNTLVQNAVKNGGHEVIAPYSAGFRAVVSTTDIAPNPDVTVHARDNTGMWDADATPAAWGDADDNVAVYWLNGDRVALSYEDFFDNEWENHAGATSEAGAARGTWNSGNNEVWTGTAGNGTGRALNALYAGTSSRVGKLTDAVNQPISNNTVSNVFPRPVYGLSEVFVVGSEFTEPTAGVTLSVSADSVTEGASALTITATLPEAASGSDVTIPLTVVAANTTAQGGDYTAPTSITVADGSTSGTAMFSVNNDTDDEPREVVTIALGTLPGDLTAGAPDRVAITIVDNDATVVSLTGANTDVREGRATATMTVSLSRALVAGETLPVAMTKIGTALLGDHYTLSCANRGVTCASTLAGQVFTVTFTGPSASSATITLTTTDNVRPDSQAAFYLQTLNQSSGTNLDGGARQHNTNRSHTITLRDRTVQLDISAANMTVTEGAAIPFNAALSNPNISGGPFTVPIQRGAGSTAGSSDHNLTLPGSISIVNNGGTGTRNLTVTDDSDDEPPETLVVELGSPLQHSLGRRTPDSITITFVDNDPTPVYLTGVNQQVLKDGGTATFEVSLGRLDGGGNEIGLVAGEELAVPLVFTGSTATRNTDYTLACGTAMGVTCANLNSGNATVTFTGPSANAVTITLTGASAATDGDRAVISLGTLGPTSGTGLGGGAMKFAGNDLVAFTLKDEITELPPTEARDNGDGTWTVGPSWPLLPSGLSAGDRFRLLFSSSTMRNGASSNADDYNAFIQNLVASGHTNIREMSADFRAVVQTGTRHGGGSSRDITVLTTVEANTMTWTDRADQGPPIHWLNGAKLADDYADFYTGMWDSNEDRNESGTVKTYDGVPGTQGHTNARRHFTGLGLVFPPRNSQPAADDLAPAPLGAGFGNGGMVGTGSLPDRLKNHRAGMTSGTSLQQGRPQDNEQFFFGISPVFIVDGTDTDPTVSVTTANTTVAEGASLTFTVSVAPTGTAMDVDLWVDDGDEDYLAAGQRGLRTVNVPAAGTTAITVGTVNDIFAERDGTITVSVVLRNGYQPSATAGSASATVTSEDLAAAAIAAGTGANSACDTTVVVTERLLGVSPTAAHEDCFVLKFSRAPTERVVIIPVVTADDGRTPPVSVTGRAVLYPTEGADTSGWDGEYPFEVRPIHDGRDVGEPRTATISLNAFKFPAGTEAHEALEANDVYVPYSGTNRETDAWLGW